MWVLWITTQPAPRFDRVLDTARALHRDVIVVLFVRQAQTAAESAECSPIGGITLATLRGLIAMRLRTQLARTERRRTLRLAIAVRDERDEQ